MGVLGSHRARLTADSGICSLTAVHTALSLQCIPLPHSSLQDIGNDVPCLGARLGPQQPRSWHAGFQEKLKEANRSALGIRNGGAMLSAQVLALDCLPARPALSHAMLSVASVIACHNHAMLSTAPSRHALMRAACSTSA